LINRTSRIREALVANSQGRQLPEEQWTKAEEDTPYLHPYISEVQREWSDRASFRTRIPTTLDSLFSLLKPKL
jgi:ubiquinol-cytochrome c reductase subunit 7